MIQTPEKPKGKEKKPPILDRYYTMLRLVPNTQEMLKNALMLTKTELPILQEWIKSEFPELADKTELSQLENKDIQADLFSLCKQPILEGKTQVWIFRSVLAVNFNLSWLEVIFLVYGYIYLIRPALAHLSLRCYVSESIEEGGKVLFNKIKEIKPGNILQEFLSHLLDDTGTSLFIPYLNDLLFLSFENLPNQKRRLALIQNYLQTQQVELSEDVNLEEIAKLTSGYSEENLKYFILKSVDYSQRITQDIQNNLPINQRLITQDDFQQTLNKLNRSLKPFSVKVLKDYRPGQGSLSLDSLAYMKAYQNKEKDREYGIRRVTKWKLLKEKTQEKIRQIGYGELEINLVLAYQTVLKRDRGKANRSRWKKPTDEQIKKIIDFVKNQTDNNIDANTVMTKLEEIADQVFANYIRERQVIHSENDTEGNPKNENDDELEELITEINKQLFVIISSCFDQHYQKLKSSRYKTFAPQLLKGWELMLIEGLSSTSIAEQLNMSSHDQVGRVFGFTKSVQLIRTALIIKLVEFSKTTNKEDISNNPTALIERTELIESYLDKRYFNDTLKFLSTGVEKRNYNNLFVEVLLNYLLASKWLNIMLFISFSKIFSQVFTSVQLTGLIIRLFSNSTVTKTT